MARFYVFILLVIVFHIQSHPSLGGEGGGLLQFALLQSLGILCYHELVDTVLDIAVHEG